MTIAVGEANGPHRVYLARDENDVSWTPRMKFLAYASVMPGTIRIAVGDASNPDRVMINHDDKNQDHWNEGASMSYRGWQEKMEFWAFDTPVPGTIRIDVGQASRPHRIMINHSDKSQDQWNQGLSMTYRGWKNKMEFLVYPNEFQG
jgi:hypothetical protein